jgi:hypothetical protein
MHVAKAGAGMAASSAMSGTGDAELELGTARTRDVACDAMHATTDRVRTPDAGPRRVRIDE